MPSDWPDVALMDINLRKMSGIKCTAKLKEMRPQLHVIMLTICGDDEQVFDSLKAGASGYLTKKASPAEIFESISEVHSGGAPMSSIIALIQWMNAFPGQYSIVPIFFASLCLRCYFQLPF